MESYRWFPNELCWKFFDQDSQRWWPENPPLPQWYVVEGAELSAERFIRIWQGAGSFSDVKKQLFWMSSTELVERKLRLDLCLRDRGYAPLKEHSMERTEQERAVFKQLATEGLLAEQSSEPERSLSNDDQGYDPVAALFQAQDRRRTEDGDGSQPHIETLEGAMRFRIRH